MHALESAGKLFGRAEAIEQIAPDGFVKSRPGLEFVWPPRP